MSNHEQPPAGEDDTVIHADFTKNKTPQGAEDQTQSGLVTPMTQQSEVMEKLREILRNPRYASVVVTQLNLNSDPEVWNVLPFRPLNQHIEE